MLSRKKVLEAASIPVKKLKESSLYHTVSGDLTSYSQKCDIQHKTINDREVFFAQLPVSPTVITFDDLGAFQLMDRHLSIDKYFARAQSALAREGFCIAHYTETWENSHFKLVIHLYYDETATELYTQAKLINKDADSIIDISNDIQMEQEKNKFVERSQDALSLLN